MKNNVHLTVMLYRFSVTQYQVAKPRPTPWVLPPHWRWLIGSSSPSTSFRISLHRPQVLKMRRLLTKWAECIKQLFIHFSLIQRHVQLPRRAATLIYCCWMLSRYNLCLEQKFALTSLCKGCLGHLFSQPHILLWTQTGKYQETPSQN